jgi:hypothetical protein
MQVGFVCSVCLSIFADQKFAICPMCDSKIAGPAGTFDKGAERAKERRERERRESIRNENQHMLLPRAFTHSFLVPSTVFFDSKVSLSPPSLSRLSLSLSLAFSLSLSHDRLPWTHQEGLIASSGSQTKRN